MLELLAAHHSRGCAPLGLRQPRRQPASERCKVTITSGGGGAQPQARAVVGFHREPLYIISFTIPRAGIQNELQAALAPAPMRARGGDGGVL